MAQSAQKPCLAAAALFAGLAVVIARLAVAPLGAADLLGIAACAAGSGAFATLAFTLRSGNAEPRLGLPSPALDTAALAEQIATAVDARLAASEERRHDDLLRAAQAARPVQTETSAPALTSDQIFAPAAAKPRLGRGLAGLMHHPSALVSPASEEKSEKAA
ncbi:MAG: hypothetical protein RLZZ50_479 [Verrucomicrobiota bacterium]|jgi:hypothetical protein